jgi:hypothetical protein
MKLHGFVIVLAVVLLALYGVITLYEQQIADSYIKLFPTQKDKSATYWNDLTYMLFYELVRLCVFAVVALYAARYLRMERIVQTVELALLKKPTITLLAICAIFFAMAWYTAYVVLDGFPNSADEVAYIFQAEVVSRGKLWDTPHRLADFFEFHHIATVDDKWVGRFPPGWPLVLAVAYVINIPALLINPIIGAITLWIVYWFCVQFYNERVALWATIGTGFTACVLFHSASFFSHSVSFLALLVFIYSTYLYLEERKSYQALLAGLFLGLLVITRYYTAFLILIPFTVCFLYRYRLSQLIPYALLVAAGTLPFMVYFFWYNHTITGSAFLPVTMWAYDDEALGFVNGHTPVKGAEYVVRRMLMFIAWVSPAYLVLYLVFLIKKLRNKAERFDHPEDYAIILLVIGYFFYYHHGGNQYGPRFYYEAIPFVIIFVVNKVTQYQYRWGYAILLTGILYALVKIPIIARHEYVVIQERQDLYRQVEEKGLRNAVVLISSGTGLLRPMPNKDLTRNDKQYQNGVLYALDLKDRNHELMKYYKDRTFYIYKRGLQQLSGKLIAIQPSDIIKEVPAKKHLIGKRKERDTN